MLLILLDVLGPFLLGIELLMALLGLRFVARSIWSGAGVFTDNLAFRFQILLLLMLFERFLIFLVRLAFMNHLLITQGLAELLLWLTFEFLLINLTELIETLVFI